MLSPLEPEYYLNTGLSFYSLRLSPQAERSFLLAIAYDENLYQAHMNLGSLLVSVRRMPEALNALSAAANLTCHSQHAPEALFNLSLCHLLLGKFDSGWSLYQSRFESGLLPDLGFPSSGFHIRSYKDLIVNRSSSIIVWAEQGLGDCIQFCRYLKFLLHLDIDFEFQCHPSLIPLISLWFLGEFPVTALSPQSSNNDCRPHLPLLSCPYIFSTTLDSIPAALPYFSAPKTQSMPSQLLVPETPGGLTVGFVWSSNRENTPMYSKKSIPIDLLFSVFQPLLSCDLVNLHSIQMGEDSHVLSPYLVPDRVFDWSEQINNFSDTAYLITQFDLVICVDTAVAHLSSSLNCPTWLLLPFDSDFRWLLDRHDSPWYPKIMRLFRQSSPDDWNSVVRELQRAFNRLFLVNLPELCSSKNTNFSL